MGQNIQIKNINHTLFLFHHFCLAVASAYPVWANFEKFEKETYDIRDPALMPIKNTMYTNLDTPHRSASAFTSNYYYAYPDRCEIHILVHLYPQCRLPICRKLLSCPWFLRHPVCSFCSVYIYTPCYTNVSGALSGGRGRR